MADLAQAFERLATLGDGASSRSPMAPTNTHVHLPPNFSAFETVDEVLDLAQSERLAVLGGSNYYDYSVYGPFIEGALDRGIYPVAGAEILSWMDDMAARGELVNDPGNPGKAYLVAKSLGHLVSPSVWARETLRSIREGDAERLRRMVGALETVFVPHRLATGLDSERVIDRVARRHRVSRDTVVLQERHVAQAFQERFFEMVAPSERQAKASALLGKPLGAGPDDAVALQSEIRACLLKAGKPAYVEEKFIPFAEAKRLVLELGGLPCYTAVADGIQPITPFEATPETLIGRLRENGVWVTEFIPDRNRVDVLVAYVLAMRRAGLVVSAGTEHNTLDRIPLVPACMGGGPIPDSIAAIFWEGACVVVGHQSEVLAGRMGYLDSQGVPNPDYRDDEARIAAFRELGERAIGRARLR